MITCMLTVATVRCRWMRQPEESYPAPAKVVEYAEWVARQQLGDAVAAAQAAGGTALSLPPDDPDERAHDTSPDVAKPA